MNDAPALMMLLMAAPVVVMITVTALNAKRINARWRARREVEARAGDDAQ